MAKKINQELPTEEITPVVQAEEQPPLTIPVEKENENKKVQLTPKKEQEPKKNKGQTDIPPFIMSVLKSHKGYESLYVDAQGGVFTPGTAPVIRKKAVLYQNPFYNNSNT